MNRDEAKFKVKRILGLEHWKAIALLMVLYDLVAVTGSYFLALWFRFDCKFSAIPQDYLSDWTRFAPIYAVFCVLCFLKFRLYRSMWRFASYSELMRTTAASFITMVAHILGITLIFGRMPVSYYIIGALIQFVLTISIRFAYRLMLLIRKTYSADTTVSKVMIIGAGAAGQMILRDANRSTALNDKVVCLIDDNPNKWGRYIDGTPIVGGRDAILENVEKYQVDKIYISLPSAPMEDRREILNICKETDCELKNLPGMYQLAKGDVSVSNLKAVSIEDLLGREPIKVEMQEVFDFIHGKTVLVTGGGGSIGSELCRQVAAHDPKTLIIFDVYENNAYSIQLELREKYPELDLVTLIGSVRDSRKMFQVFEKYRPDVVYHAAAHKHVPLMEDSPCEAIKNNAIGTYKTAFAAMIHGCKRFVLISTDKAVNPTNIMGASKRLCEMIIQSFDAKIKEGRADEIPQLFTHYVKDNTEILDAVKNRDLYKNIDTEFVALRFGNVLGSNGSVIPIFKKQIEKGGPVTVTHPDIIRYFMTIPEAVSLVMLAGTYAKGGEIFVLDMGSPVKIDSLARNLIRLSGLKPDIDIKIEYTGLRPGEKLYEEKLMAEEGLRKTKSEKIHIGCPIPFDTDEFLDSLEPLMDAAYSNRDDIRELVARIVTTYHQEGEVVDEKKYKELLSSTAV
ncbi:MAG: polysaccharide biosynthesis protein [Ruminococcus sp.]|nr:polysaccharide biosynthesis protein [Ruminococcus sp.]